MSDNNLSSGTDSELNIKVERRPSYTPSSQNFNFDDAQTVLSSSVPRAAPASTSTAAAAGKKQRHSIIQSIFGGTTDGPSTAAPASLEDGSDATINVRNRSLSDTRILSPYFNLNFNAPKDEEKPEILLSDQVKNDGKFAGLFPGWGSTRVIAIRYDPAGEASALADASSSNENISMAERNESFISWRKKHPRHEEAKMGLVASVSIAGCDLLSSCLYTAGTCASYAGKLAPIGLIIVTVMLMFFRHVYGEVVSCIPINGGTYNSILNTSTKKAAALAGCLSILAYVATAIISSYESIVYLQILWPGVDLRGGTIVVQTIFLCLTLYGVKESSWVSIMMLSFHLTIMTVLILWCFIHGCMDGFAIFRENMYSPLVTIADESGHILSDGRLKVLGAIFYGYSAALLGITGFESAANYVESLDNTKTFVSTVNWLWVLVGIFNPCLSIVSMMVLPMEKIYESPSELLAIMAEKVGGHAFSQAVCVDAVLVLCGAVLTSFVGVSGLLIRLSNDKVLPAFVAISTSSGSPVVASILFFLISVSLFIILFDPTNSQQISAFGGVYAIAFLCVLVAFASSAIMLKLNRSNMARLVIARWWEIYLSLFAVAAGLIGNITLTPKVFILFLIYLVAFSAVCAYMFLRVDLFSFAIWMLRKSIITQENTETAMEVENSVIRAADIQKKFKEYNLCLNEEFKLKENILFPAGDSAVRDGSVHGSAKRTSLGGDGEGEGGIAGEGVIQFIKRTSNSVIEVVGGGMRRRSASMDSVDAQCAADEKKDDKDRNTVPVQLSLARTLMQGIRRSMSAGSMTNEIQGAIDNAYRQPQKELLELDAVMSHNRFLGWLLTFFMKSLDEILKEPFVYLCKSPDPIVLRLAMEYINDNELTNNILLVHFVDDREIMKAHRQFMLGIRQEILKKKIPADQEELYSQSFLLQSTMVSRPDGEAVHDLQDFLKINPDNMDITGALEKLPTPAKKLSSSASLFDTYYSKKKVSCVVVRGSYFCPSAVKWLSDYLNLPVNSMIMGTPDDTFPFPIGDLGGIRIALPEPTGITRDHASGSVIQATSGLKYMRF